ncbi:MAG TPA: hypothetical protein VF746_03540 [Longimicrobium sp.]|jgi:hypothetical protein
MISLADTLDTLSAHFPAALLPPEEYAAARAAAAALPAALTRWTYLECRLGGRPAPVDVIVEVDAAGREIITGANPALALPPGLAAAPAWERVAGLCRRWADPADPLHPWVDSLWLEFDVDPRAGGAPPLPGVFVAFTPAAFGTGTAGERSARTEAALEALLGGALDPARRAALRRVYRCLPGGATVLYAGCLLPRGTRALRVCPVEVSARDLPAFLRAAGWPGPYAPLEAALAQLSAVREGAPARDAALVHLDLDAGGVLGRLGLEYVFGRRTQVRGEICEAAFLDHLVGAGLCTAQERDAMAAFPGAAREQLPHELWKSLVVRRVNHVKLVFDAGRVEAKAYLCLHNRFLPRRPAPSPAAAPELAAV